MKHVLSAVAMVMLIPWTAHATPSSTFWTPMTLDVQPYGLLHVGVDNYFTMERTRAEGASAFATDLGLTLGVLPGSKLQAEAGVDYFAPSDHPWVFSFKLGVPERALWPRAPAFQAGMFGLGTGPGTNENVLYGIVGKSLPPIGRMSVGPYAGNGSVLRSPSGEEERSGFMVAYDRGLLAAQGSGGDAFQRVVVAADYASGHNVLGGGGIALYYYFSSAVSLEGGPVWFTEKALNGENKWSLQLDINQPRLFAHH